MASVYGKERFVVNNKMERKYDLECPPFHSGHLQRKCYFYFENLKNLRIFQILFFTGRGRDGKRQLQPLAPCGGTNPLRRFAPALPKGEPRPWRERFLPLSLKDFPRSGEDVAQRQKGDKVSPKVTERAHPLPCGELPPQRLRGLQIGEARKMLLAKRLAFFRFDFSFGIIKGEQPLIRCGVGGVQRKGGGSRSTPPYLWPSGASRRRCLL